MRSSELLDAQIASEWARVGGGFTVAPARGRVDIEDLLVRSVVRSPTDYRLFFVAATWLGTHHHLVNVRHLAKKLGSLEALPSAVAGAMFGVAQEVDASDRLAALQNHCRSLGQPRALFDRTQRNPVLRKFARQDALPVFTRWGLWHDEISLKIGAIRPVRWILKHCSEIQVRALFGPGLDADVVEHLRGGAKPIAALSRSAHATYSATHAAVSRLAARGIVESVEGQYGVALTDVVAKWLDDLPTVDPTRQIRRSA